MIWSFLTMKTDEFEKILQWIARKGDERELQEMDKKIADPESEHGMFFQQLYTKVHNHFATSLEKQTQKWLDSKDPNEKEKLQHMLRKPLKSQMQSPRNRGTNRKLVRATLNAIGLFRTCSNENRLQLLVLCGTALQELLVENAQQAKAEGAQQPSAQETAIMGNAPTTMHLSVQFPDLLIHRDKQLQLLKKAKPEYAQLYILTEISGCEPEELEVLTQKTRDTLELEIQLARAAVHIAV